MVEKQESFKGLNELEVLKGGEEARRRLLYQTSVAPHTLGDTQKLLEFVLKQDFESALKELEKAELSRRSVDQDGEETGFQSMVGSNNTRTRDLCQ